MKYRSLFSAIEGRYSFNFVILWKKLKIFSKYLLTAWFPMFFLENGTALVLKNCSMRYLIFPATGFCTQKIGNFPI